MDVARRDILESGRFRGAYAWVKPRRALFFLDILAAAGAVALAWGWLWGADHHLAMPRAAVWSHDCAFIAVAVAAIAIMTWDGVYEEHRRLSRVDDAIELGKALVLAFLVGVGLAFVTKGFGTGYTDYSRLAIVRYAAGMLVFMAAARWAMWAWQQRLFARGEGVRRLVVAGAGAAATELSRLLADRPWLGYMVAGHISVLARPTRSELLGGLPLQAPLLGGIRDLPAALYSTGAGEVIIALDRDEQPLLPELVAAMQALGAPFRVVASQFEVSYRDVRAMGVESVVTASAALGRGDHAQRALKRVCDVVCAGAGLVVLAPLFAVVALAIRASSRGGVIYRQTRVSRGGRRFQMYKFRTMYRDADQRLGEVAHLNEGSATLFKIRADPRITPVGLFLRKWSIDELPQLVNVLRGDMSLVGPRPPLPAEVERYGTADLVRLKGKPGITGLWQVEGRSDVPFEKMVDLDRYYLQHWSLTLDFSILVRTIGVVLLRRGAY